LHDLALLRQKQGNLNEAVSLAQRALTIRAQSLGETHPKTVATTRLYTQLVQEQKDVAEPTLEHIRTLLKARGWSLHLKKRHSKPYVYATRKVGTHSQSRYLAPLSDLTACLVAAGALPNARE
jgi:Tetratricopeptide repeat